MAINLQSTSNLTSSGVKFLVYGQAGAGKTTLIPSLPKPVVFSAEGGLLSIAGASVPYVEIKSIDELYEAYTWLTQSEEARQFETVALDSISEVAELVLSHELAKTKDPRQAYGALQDKMRGLIRNFRDLDRNVYFTAKLEKSEDEMGMVRFAPSMPGKALTKDLPYFFDEVFALRVESVDGKKTRALMTDSDGYWSAKDRSGKLAQYESPDLGALIRKIGGG